jgi:uncharacterized membrane-anchored protein YhcB (DUF1043 family)
MIIVWDALSVSGLIVGVIVVGFIYRLNGNNHQKN